MLKMGHLFKKASRPSLASYNKICSWPFLAFFLAISYLIHQFMVKVGHLEFSKAPGCLINVTRAEVLLEQENNLFDQVLDRAQAPADPPNIVQPD